MIFKNSLIYIAGELLAKVFPILLMPYLARRLGVVGYGELAFYLSITQLMGIFVSFSSHAAISRYYFRYGERSIGLPIMAAILFGCIMTVLCTFVAIILGVSFAWVLAVCAFGNSLLACGLSVLQCQKRAGLYVFLQLLNIAFSTLLTIALLELYSAEPVLRLMALMVASMLAAFGIQFALGRVGYLWSRRKLCSAFIYLLVFGAPLLVHGFCNFLRFEFDKIALKAVFSPEELGVYALAAKLGAIVQLVLMAVNKSLQPTIYKSLKESGGADVISQLKLPTIFVVALIPLTVLAVPEALLLRVFGSEFEGLKPLIIVFSLGYSILAPYFLFVNVAFYYSWSKLISSAAVLSVLTYIGMFYFFMKNEMYSYIPWALVASSFVLAVVIIVPVDRKLKKLGKC